MADRKRRASEKKKKQEEEQRRQEEILRKQKLREEEKARRKKAAAEMKKKRQEKSHAMEKYESVASVCSGNSSTNSAEALSMCVKGIANCQQHLGFAYLQLRQYVEAQEALEHAVQLYQKLEDQVGQANSLHSVSTSIKQLILTQQNKKRDLL